MLADPVTMAPASRRRLTAVESMGAMKSLRIVEAADDCIPLVRMLSLMAMGIPSSLDLGISKKKNALELKK